jgi:phosphatidylglycerophosphatase A
MTRLAVLLATAGGAGYAPVAPGTFGSAIGVVAYLLTCDWPLVWQATLVILVTAAGVWSASAAEAHFGRHDPGYVVIDEVAGQWVTLLATGAGPWGAFAGFLVFRLFDVTKPWPARKLEALPAGLGIMADDLMAAIYGNIVMQIGIRLLSGTA